MCLESSDCDFHTSMTEVIPTERTNNSRQNMQGKLKSHIRLSDRMSRLVNNNLCRIPTQWVDSPESIKTPEESRLDPTRSIEHKSIYLYDLQERDGKLSEESLWDLRDLKEDVLDISSASINFPNNNNWVLKKNLSSIFELTEESFSKTLEIKNQTSENTPWEILKISEGSTPRENNNLKRYKLNHSEKENMNVKANFVPVQRPCMIDPLGEDPVIPIDLIKTIQSSEDKSRKPFTNLLNHSNNSRAKLK